MIWEPFVLALVLGIIISAGLYFAYLWPSVEPLDDEAVGASDAAGVPAAAPPEPAATPPEPAGPSTPDDAASAP